MLASPKSNSFLNQDSRKYLSVQADDYLQQLYSSNNYSQGSLTSINPSANYILSKNSRIKDNVLMQKISSLKQIKNSKALLVDTEERIFAEVIGLVE